MNNNAMKYVFIIALVAIPLCSGQNNTTDSKGQSGGTTTDQAKKPESPLQKGMNGIFAMYHKFLDVVMPKSFYRSDTPFNVDTLSDVLKKSDFGRLQKNWQDLAKTYGGYAACVIMGFIFVVFMPIVGCIYCCCHCCCNKCGGTREMMDPKRAVCKRWTYTIILLSCTTLMLAGGIITFLGSDLLHRSLKNENGNGLVGNLHQSVETLEVFVNDTVNDVVTEGKKKVFDGVDKILPQIKGAVNHTVDRIKGTINATSLLRQARDLGNDSKDALAEITKVQELLTSLTNLQKNVTETFAVVNSSVSSNCNSSTCGNVTSLISSLSFKPNYSTLGNLSGQLTEIGQAANISDLVNKAEEEFNNVTVEINNKVQSNVDASEKKVNEAKSSVETEIHKLDTEAKPVVDALRKWREFPTEEQNKVIHSVADYIWYACIGLGCAVLLVVFFYYLAIVCGLCGERPGPRANCCNRGTGSNLLCAGICFSFLFAWLLMLVTILLFAVGGLSYSMGCKYVIHGVEGVETFETVVKDGFGFSVGKLLNDTNLTISSMLTDCKQDKGLYTALSLQNMFDIDRQFNLSDVMKQIEGIASSSNFNLGNITLLTTDLKDQLDKFRDASLSAIDFHSYRVELNKTLVGSGNLSDVVHKLRSTALMLPPVKAAAVNDSADKLQHLEDVTFRDIDRDKANLTTTIDNLQQISNRSVSDKINSLMNSMIESQNKYNAEKDEIISDELKKAVENITGIINDTVRDTVNFIKNDVGKCKKLYDAAQSTVDAVCVVTLDPLNCIWFGLGWSLFFYIPCFIFAALLASLYKRSEKYTKKQDFDDPITSQHSAHYDNGYAGARRDDTVPLTSMDKDHRKSANGAYNQGYEGRHYEQEARFHRDRYPDYPPDSYTRDRAASNRGSYAQPYMDHYDQPPMYDDAITSSHYRGGHGGYPNSRLY